MTADNTKFDPEVLSERIKALETRMATIESALASGSVPIIPKRTSGDDSDYVNLNLSMGAPFETRFGEYGLAWLGNIVLFFAIAFLWQYFNNAGKPFIASFSGMISVAGIFFLSHFFRERHAYLSSTFRLFGFLILFYVLLRMYYFNNHPLVPSQFLASSVVLIAVTVQFLYARWRKSEMLAGLALAMAFFTAYLWYEKAAFFSISILVTGISILIFWKYNWWRVLTFVICAGFIVNLVWLLNNPVSLAKTPADLTYHFTFAYFSLITAMYSLLAFKKQSDKHPANLILTLILFAGIFYAILLLVMIILQFQHHFAGFFLAISLYCILYSVLLKYLSPWDYAPALFVLFGFLAISVAVLDTYHLPGSFLMLTVQSFVVLAVALWYRSHMITLINTFLLIALAGYYYIQTSGGLVAVNFSIPVVAFLSARIINWQKERLNIKTSLIRNIYLLILFFSLLYATYNALPSHYVTVSWLVVAGIYFVLSIILDNFKYRWMAMANLLVSAFHLFLVDLAQINLLYRILAFLFFSIVSIIISIYYVNKLKRKDVPGTSTSQI